MNCLCFRAGPDDVVCYLFRDVFSVVAFIYAYVYILNDTTVNDQLEKAWKEAVVACLKYSPEWKHGTHGRYSYQDSNKIRSK
jgi:hypothetical protein